MLEALDIRTLSLTNLIFSLIFGLGLVVYSYNHKTFKGISVIGWGFVCLASGFFLLGMRQYIHDFFSIVIANTLILAAMLMVYDGLVKFRQVDLVTPKYWYPLAVFVTFGSFSFLTFVEPDINARIMVISAMVALQSTMIGYALLYCPNKPTGLANSLLGSLYFAFAIVNLVRIVFTFGQQPLGDFMQASLVHGFTLLAFEVLVLYTAFSVVWIASSILEKELFEQTREDPLTGIYNRRALEDIAHIELSRSRRTKHTLSIVICDIDFFKRCNDTHGHQAGDIVLQEFAHLLRHHIREHDVLARFGGEEFLILLPETELEDAVQLADKLRQQVKELKIAVDRRVIISVTASFGVTASTANNFDWHTLLKTSDTALYQAKSEGRDRVCSIRADQSEKNGNTSSNKNVVIDYRKGIK